ncbi:MAG: hypothetical protein AB3N64_01050 [Puniceicoccaceae bacterium]
MLLLGALLGGSLQGEAAIVIEGFSSGSNDRFSNDPAFVAAAYDLSAIGLNESGRWGTLVSGNVILSANHFFPAIGSTMTFHQSNDPSGESVSRQLIAGQRVEDSDLWLGVLADPVPAGYTPMSFTDEAIANTAGFFSSSHAGEEAFMVGRSPSSFPLVTDMALGKNILNDWIEDFSDSGTVDQAVLAYQDLPDDPDFVSFEAYLQIGDSGAPLLRDVGGVLTLIGINWFIGTVDIDSRPAFEDLRNLSGFSYIGNYAASLDASISAFSVDATAGYVSWMNSAFGTTDWAVAGPAVDFDGDGLDNFTEYAFVLDPSDPTDPVPLLSGTTELTGARHLQAVFSTREDPDLQYTVEVGSDLAGWTSVSLSFDGSWSSSDPAEVIVEGNSPNGDGTWNLTVRDANALQPGAPRFIRASAQ